MKILLHVSRAKALTLIDYLKARLREPSTIIAVRTLILAGMTAPFEIWVAVGLLVLGLVEVLIRKEAVVPPEGVVVTATPINGEIR